MNANNLKNYFHDIACQQFIDQCTSITAAISLLQKSRRHDVNNMVLRHICDELNASYRHERRNSKIDEGIK